MIREASNFTLHLPLYFYSIAEDVTIVVKRFDSQSSKMSALLVAEVEAQGSHFLLGLDQELGSFF